MSGNIQISSLAQWQNSHFNEVWGRASFGQQGAHQHQSSSAGLFLLLPDPQLKWQWLVSLSLPCMARV